MGALGRGELEAAHASVNIVPVKSSSHDELGEMAESFNVLQEEVREAALGLGEAREKLRNARAELLARHRYIAHLAHHDALTNLPNRTALAEWLDHTIEHAKKNRTSFAVVTVDLDHFKEANDLFGHVIGDELLCAISRRLQQAAGSTFIARVGGDEFALVSAAGEQPQTAQVLAQRLLDAVAKPFEVGGQLIPIGLSIGSTIYPQDAADIDGLIANADAALYRAKADGRHMVRFFEPEMDRRLRERYACNMTCARQSPMVSSRCTISRKPRLTERYLASRRYCAGVTRSAAWCRRTFIPLAEQNGMIAEIGEWTLRQVCAEAASWPRPLQVGVNLSPVQFRHGDLAGLVHSVLADTGLAPNRLELEITEGVLIKDQARALSTLRRLKLLGVKIAMDDFGTGYASLSSLQSFPFDKLKIDKTFVCGVESNLQSEEIVRAVIGLGRALKIPVIAEGVETDGERVFLMLEGCEQLQGYLIGRPAPITTYAELTNGARANALMAG
jgi:diguanylate cyclase (GGDEF)-like protein